jgi:hypothetical protein
MNEAKAQLKQTKRIVSRGFFEIPTHVSSMTQASTILITLPAIITGVVWNKTSLGELGCPTPKSTVTRAFLKRVAKADVHCHASLAPVR